MKILLLGEYSRLHLTLAEGLRKLGHEAVVASDGDGHKRYARDIDLTRTSSSIKDTLSALIDINNKFAKFKEFDVVQLINPCFITLSVGVNKCFFKQLRRNNKKVFLGAFGDDSYWIKASKENKILTYSEFFIDGKSTNLQYNKALEKKWLSNKREKLNNYIADNVDGVIACIYEYYKAYEPYYSEKLQYIPLPIHVKDIPFIPITEIPEKIKFFIGIDRLRSEYKGTDLMERVLTEFAEEHPQEVEIIKAESVGYDIYQKMVAESHVLLDQLYSHSPSVNPLQAMAQGKVVISGGEPEMYELIGEIENRPIINVHPTEQGIREALEYVLKNKQKLPEWSRQGRLFVEQHHDSVKIAQQYIDFWSK